MTSAGIRAYVHDDNANRTQITETPSGGPTTTVATDTYDRTAANSPGLDELTTMTVDGKTTTFDDNGDGRVTTQAGSVGRTMSWDGHDRWTGGTFGTTTVVNTLDPAGKLQQRRANGNDATTTRHSYAGGSPVFVLNDDGTTITTTNIDGPVGAVATYHGPPTAGSVVTFPYFNGHGDSTATADSTGARTGLVKSYDPFGNQDVASYTNGTDEAWTGAWHKKTDISANLVHMGAWPYDPTRGRFLSVDPIDGGNPNNYEYASQDPVDGYDLTGECDFYTCMGNGVKKAGKKAGKWAWKNQEKS